MSTCRYRYFALIFLLFVRPNLLQAQPAIQWQNNFGGTGSDIARAIVQTADGGYAVAGSTNSLDGEVNGLKGIGDSTDAWVVKMDASGALQWAKTFGGSGNDGINAIVQTSDGGYVMAGYSNSSNGDVPMNQGNYDLWVIKLSGAGALLWSETFGGSREDRATAIVQTFDGGFALAGYTRSADGDVTFNHGGYDYWLIKLNTNGSLVWQQTYGGGGDDQATALVQSTDSGFAIVGTTFSNNGDVTGNHGNVDAWILKTDSLGKPQWQSAVGGSGEDAGSAIVETADSGFAMAGYTASTDGDVSTNHGGWDVWLVKLSKAGSMQWENTYGGSQYDEAWAMTKSDDGGFTLAGQTTSKDGDITRSHGSADYWVLNTGPDGTLNWQETLGGLATEEAFSVVQTTDRGFAIAGFSGSQDGDITHNFGAEDFWVVKLQGPVCNDIRVGISPNQVKQKAGSVVDIPIIAYDTSARKVSTLDIALGVNTDLLTPISIDTTSGEFSHAKVTRFIVAHDSLTARLELATPIIITPGVLAVIHCIAYVTDTIATAVSIERLTFEDSTKKSDCLTPLLVNAPDSEFTVTLVNECGERSTSLALSNENALIFESVAPNPTSGDVVVRIRLPENYQSDAMLELYDALGNKLDVLPIITLPGGHCDRDVAIPLHLRGSSGLRYLRVEGGNAAATARLLLER